MKGRGGSPLFCFHQEDRLSQIVESVRITKLIRSVDEEPRSDPA